MDPFENSIEQYCIPINSDYLLELKNCPFTYDYQNTDTDAVDLATDSDEQQVRVSLAEKERVVIEISQDAKMYKFKDVVVDDAGNGARAEVITEAGGGRRQLPASMSGGERRDVGSSKNNVSFKGLMEVVSKVIGNATAADNNNNADFFETAQRRGLTLHRPRWWPPQGFDA